MKHNNIIKIPSSDKIKNHCLDALSVYWPNNQNLISKLPIKNKIISIVPGKPLKLAEVRLPDWADHCGVNNKILIPDECIMNTKESESNWDEIDWFLAIFLLLECWHERLWEAKFGPIHSYSFRLKGWDKRAWEHAWVNRIALFLKEWAAQENTSDVKSLFGKEPISKIRMTHDVDAIRKTFAIRIKQSMFIIFNSLKSLSKGNFKESFKKLKKSISFLLSNENWMVLDKLLNHLNQFNIVSTFHFYGDLQKKGPKKILIDPGYKVNSKVLKTTFNDIILNNHEVGLHPSFDSYNNIEKLSLQKNALEHACGCKVTSVRQHWLRFSWSSTWNCQESVGLELDTTLMFNDRPGFRNSSALLWNPWNQNKSHSHKIKALPSIIMDSHIYDYLELDERQHSDFMRSFIKECKMLNGEAAVLWHPHTLTNDYGWSSGFTKLLNLIE